MNEPGFNTDAALVFAGDTTSPEIGAAITAPAGARIYVALYLRNGHDGQTITPLTSGVTPVEAFGSGGANQPSIVLFEKTSTGAESGTYGFTLSTSDICYIQSWWVSGGDESDPLPATHRDSNNSGTGTPTTIDAPSVTTVRDHCRILRMAIWRDAGANPTFGLTPFEAVGSRGTSEQETQATAGATGTAAAVVSSAAGRVVAVTLAFQPPDAPSDPISTLQDSFDTQIDPATWDVTVDPNATVTWIGGKVELAAEVVGGVGATAILDTDAVYDLEDDAVFAEITDFVVPDLGHVWFGVKAADFSIVRIFISADGTIRGRLDDIPAAETNQTIFSTTYNATTHRWLRVREAAGTIFVDAASDGVNWSNLGSIVPTTDPATLFGSVQVDFGGTVFSGGGEGNRVEAWLDNVNVASGLPEIIDKAVFDSEVDNPAQSYTVPANTGLLVVFGSARDSDEDSELTGVSLSTDGALFKERADESRMSVSRMAGGVFSIATPTAGAQTLTLTWSGTAPARRRAHIFALSGTGLFVRDVALDSDLSEDDEGFTAAPPRQATVLSQVGDRVLDYIAWRDTDVDVASIGAGQTQELSEGGPGITQNSTSKPGGASSTTMEVTADSGGSNNVFLYYAVSIGQDQGEPSQPTLSNVRASADVAIEGEVAEGLDLDTDSIEIRAATSLPIDPDNDTVLATFSGTPPEGTWIADGLTAETPYHVYAKAININGYTVSAIVSLTTWRTPAHTLTDAASLEDVAFVAPAGYGTAQIEVWLGKLVYALAGQTRDVDFTITVKDSLDATIGSVVVLASGNVEDGTLTVIPIGVLDDETITVDIVPDIEAGGAGEVAGAVWEIALEEGTSIPIFAHHYRQMAVA